MTEPGSESVRTIAFGDLATGLWACIWGEESAAAVLGAAGGDRLTGQPAITGSSDGRWSVAGGGLELEVSPLGDPVDAPELGGFDQLCRVQGRLVLASGELPVACLGRRSTRAGLDLRKLDSIRDCSGWFDSDEGFGLSALRPRRARGHGQDTVRAAWFESTRAVAVAEPRLSSTYGSDGRLLHAGLELWLDDEPESYPRRAAADTLSAGESVAVGHLDLQAWPLVWRSHGREGAGVYLLAVPR